MDITDIKIRKVETEGNLKAYVTITFDNCFVVHNLKIITGNAGLFVAMPSRRTRNGEFKDIVHPINSQFRDTLQTKILDEYNSDEVNVQNTERSYKKVESQENIKPQEKPEEKEEVVEKAEPEENVGAIENAEPVEKAEPEENVGAIENVEPVEKAEEQEDKTDI